MKKVVAYNEYWKCANADSDADIIEEGDAILFDDNTTELVPYGEQPKTQFSEMCNENEIKDFLKKYKKLCFVGDTVKIVKGRKMVGSTKVVAKTFTYMVNRSTSVDYLVFTDNTRCLMDNCVNEYGNEIYECLKTVDSYKFYHLGGRKY